jgi:pilus assembly protein CpaF
MSFLFDVPPLAPERPRTLLADVAHAETFYKDLIDRRPALLEEKLKLHARIIDEFNLTLLDKLPRAELVRQVHA